MKGGGEIWSDDQGTIWIARKYFNSAFDLVCVVNRSCNDFDGGRLSGRTNHTQIIRTAVGGRGRAEHNCNSGSAGSYVLD